jgi:uncharacterized protein
MFLVSAFIIGFLGSFHCVGMCGPIALSLPVHQYGLFKKNVAILLYNLGRLTTYTLLGIIFALLGQSFSLIGFQQWVSISLGVLLLISVLLPQIKLFQSIKIPILTQAINKLKSSLGRLFHKRGLRFLFGIGILNSLLPCGLVYIGIAGALASQTIQSGALFMLFFGLGTVPIMYAVALAGQFINLRFRIFVRKSIPYAVSIMAILFILRGLNLGIPYVSPSFDAKTKTVSCCTHKICKK